MHTHTHQDMSTNRPESDNNGVEDEDDEDDDEDGDEEDDNECDNDDEDDDDDGDDDKENGEDDHAEEDAKDDVQDKKGMRMGRVKRMNTSGQMGQLILLQANRYFLTAPLSTEHSQ